MEENEVIVKEEEVVAPEVAEEIADAEIANEPVVESTPESEVA